MKKESTGPWNLWTYYGIWQGRIKVADGIEFAGGLTLRYWDKLDYLGGPDVLTK